MQMDKNKQERAGHGQREKRGEIKKIHTANIQKSSGYRVY